MENVLIIANQFPPMGGSGVQRTSKFVKHLQKFNYNPIVFTRNADGAILKDETLLKDIPKDIKIIRTKAFEPADVQGIFKIPCKILSKLMIPDSAKIWFETSKKLALKIIKENNIKIIYTTSAPYSDHLLGLYIKSKIPTIKWVVDFRDEWTNNPYTLDNPHNFFRTYIEKNLEKKVLYKSDYIISNTPVMQQNFIKIYNKFGYENCNDKFFVIPNGYDEEDFFGLDFKKVKNEKFTMTYTGALYGRRKPDNFFLAIKSLIDKNLINKDKILVNLIGNYNSKLQQKINSLNLFNQIKVLGYMPHNVCVQNQIKADALILIEGSGVGANAFYTGKIFEYMNTKVPVLAFLPDGVAKDLILQTNIGIVANTDDIFEIEKAILNYYEKWLQNSLDFSPDWNIIKNFERKNLTKSLAHIFDKALNL